MSIYDVSNPTKAYINWKKYDKNAGDLYFSNKKNKKYMIINPNTNKEINFGDIRYKDYTKTNDEKKRNLYLKRATNIKGNWKKNKYSPNNLSINILWM